MFKREKDSGHFTIRHTPDFVPKRRMRPWMIFPMLLAIVMLNLRGMVNGPSSPAASMTQDTVVMVVALQEVVDSLNRGSWGLETLDRAHLLAEQLATGSGEHQDAAAAYLALLLAGAPPGEAPQELLEDVGRFLGAADKRGNVTQKELDRYRLALQAVNEARLP